MAMYRIHRFSKLTGLSTHLIRAWERRYGLVTPVRGANRYRLYNDEDVQLFRYLKSKIDQGLSIGELAEIGREQLIDEAKRDSMVMAFESPPSEGLVWDLSQAIQKNDRSEFERKLNGALAVIPFEEALFRFLLPLQKEVGQLWHDGKIGVAQEHYASNQIKQKIYSARNQLRMVEEGPRIVVACPPQEWHEISAMAVAYICGARGCLVHYLGANLPIAELAEYCKHHRPSYVLLSMTIDRSDEEGKNLVHELVSQIRPIAPIGVGGRYVQAHPNIFSNGQITVFPDLKALEALVFSLTH